VDLDPAPKELGIADCKIPIGFTCLTTRRMGTPLTTKQLTNAFYNQSPRLHRNLKLSLQSVLPNTSPESSI